MASAVALGHDSLRLRSRRVRSDRSHRLSWALVVAVIVSASAVGFLGARISRIETQTTPVVDAATLDEQRFATGVRPIHAEIEQSVITVGLVVAAYENGDINQKELQRRLAGVLASYQDTAGQVDALAPPPGHESTVQGYVDTLNALAHSSSDLSKAFDDGDQGRVSAALAVSLQTAARLNDLLDPSAPARD